MKADITTVMFVLVSVWVLLTGLYVVLTSNIVRAAFALLATLFGVAVLYALLEADFLSAVQVLIYVGGINILIIFGVMLTEQVGRAKLKMVSMNLLPAAIVCFLLFAVLILSLLTYPWLPVAQAPGPATAGIGKSFLTTYLLPFEVASVLLLAVLIGAVSVGRKEVRD